MVFITCIRRYIGKGILPIKHRVHILNYGAPRMVINVSRFSMFVCTCVCVRERESVKFLYVFCTSCFYMCVCVKFTANTLYNDNDQQSDSK